VQPVEQLLSTIFTPTSERKRQNLWQVKDVQKELEKHLRPSDIPTLKYLSTILKKLRWPKGGSNGTEGYYLKLRK
jgi:hypothetical protein